MVRDQIGTTARKEFYSKDQQSNNSDTLTMRNRSVFLIHRKEILLQYIWPDIIIIRAIIMEIKENIFYAIWTFFKAILSKILFTTEKL